MPRSKIVFTTLFAALVGLWARSVPAQPQIAPQGEITLPSQHSADIFGLRSLFQEENENEFSTGLAPDQSLLVYEPGPNGKWPLIRVTKWWTKNPIIEVLQIPAWGGADAKGLIGRDPDLKITSDGRYAVLFSMAQWVDHGQGRIVPPGFKPRDTDTLVTVVDLKNWQVGRSTRIDTVDNSGFGRGNILGDRWVGWVGFHGGSMWKNEIKIGGDAAFPFGNILFSLPDLTPGPKCISRNVYAGDSLWGEPHSGFYEHLLRLEDSLDTEDKTDCADLLNASGIASVHAFRSETLRQQDAEPDALKLLQYWRYKPYYSSDKVLLQRAELDQASFWGTVGYPAYFDSSSHQWYGIFAEREINPLYRDPQGGNYYHLFRVTQAGKVERSEKLNLEMSHCEVEDVRRNLNTVLGDCAFQSDPDFATIHDKHVLPIFRADDLSMVGTISTAAHRGTKAVIAAGDGHPYVLTVEKGERLRVFRIPNLP